jgi:hypothetical protein
LYNSYAKSVRGDAMLEDRARGTVRWARPLTLILATGRVHDVDHVGFASGACALLPGMSESLGIPGA